MGRQYKGDINGKFWFAIQDSDTADRFGVHGLNLHILYIILKNKTCLKLRKKLRILRKV